MKSIILKIFKLLQNNPDTGRIFLQPPLILFKHGNFFVRSVFQTSSVLNVVYEKISVAGSHFGTHGHAIDLYKNNCSQMKNS